MKRSIIVGIFVAVVSYALMVAVRWFSGTDIADQFVRSSDNAWLLVSKVFLSTILGVMATAAIEEIW